MRAASVGLADMDPAAILERQLAQATQRAQWIDVLAAWFDAHGLHYGHGTDNARDEAYWLVSHLHDYDPRLWDARPDPALVPRLLGLAVARAVERRPLAYLLGEAWFAGLRFRVDERVLIPRSPLAEVIERGFEPWCALAPGDRVLDIGTGSGCLAIAAAHYCPDVVVDATDTSAAALELAAGNVARHGLQARIRLFEADLYPSGDTRYRVIMANPPYVPDAEIITLPPEYRHEPVSGLAAGPTGLEAAMRVLDGALKHLTDDGVLIVEVGAGHEAFAAARSQLPLIWLEFERGGVGVFVASAADLAK